MAQADQDDLAVSVTDRYFEDYVPGAICVYGDIVMTEADILDFARRYDPQPMHTNADAATSGPFGGLIASGWHTTACVMRVLVERYLSHVAAIVSPVSRSKPDRGLVRTFIEALNQRGEVVLSMKAMNLMRRRSPIDGRASATAQ